MPDDQIIAGMVEDTAELTRYGRSEELCHPPGPLDRIGLVRDGAHRPDLSERSCPGSVPGRLTAACHDAHEGYVTLRASTFAPGNPIKM